jgi:phospholipid/cholesterol/gamma-HCH transport system permease protein
MNALVRFGGLVLAGVEWVGGVTRLVGHTIRVGPRRPWGIDDVARQLVEQGIRSLPIGTFMSLFIGMILAWQFGWALKDFGATMALGDASSLALVRELVPTLMAVTVGAKMAAGMAAELGSMKVTEQIDAVAALGADPVKKLVWPRIIAATLSLPLLCAWGNVMALLGGMLVGEYYVSSIVKATIFGFLVGTVGCFQGLSTKFGTEAVGVSTTESVVATSICIIIADFYLTMVFF